MNKKHFRYLMILGLVLALSSTAFGQGQGDNTSGMLRADLERTDQMIESARDAVRASNVIRAQVALENAVHLQDEAWDQFRDGSSAALKNAGVWTRQAREQAKSALASARYTQQKQDVVLRKLERANELLQRSKEELNLQQATQMNQALTALYEATEDNIRNAWEFYRNGEYSPALKLANQVENAVRKIVSTTNKRAQGAANFERYSDNVDQQLANIQAQIADCNSETAIKLMEEARELFESARELSGQENSAAAMEALKAARKLATRAQLECSGFDGSLSERYERIKNEADIVSESIAADNDSARQLMDQVYEQLDLAAGYIGEGQTQQAAASLKAAQLSLNQLNRLLEAGTE